MLGLTESGVYEQVELPDRWHPMHLIKGGISIDWTTYYLFLFMHTYTLYRFACRSNIYISRAAANLRAWCGISGPLTCIHLVVASWTHLHVSWFYGKYIDYDWCISTIFFQYINLALDECLYLVFAHTKCLSNCARIVCLSYISRAFTFCSKVKILWDLRNILESIQTIVVS